MSTVSLSSSDSLCRKAFGKCVLVSDVVNLTLESFAIMCRKVKKLSELYATKC